MTTTFCPDGRILIHINNQTTQVPESMVKDKVQLTFSEWLQYLTQLHQI